MKKILACISFLMLTSNLQLKCQDIPPPNPGLVLNIVSGYSYDFIFDEIDEYINGIYAGQSTFIRIGAIYNWKLQFKADNDMFYGITDPSNHMELNNLGLTVVSTGTNQDDGSNIINYAKFVPVVATVMDETLLTKGALSNKGYGIENSFTLNWELGTQNGVNMNTMSLLDQMLAPDIYTVTITLTLSAY
jgi:hypothetical protein